MAAVVASQSAGAPSKMKKPSVPLVQTNGNSVRPNQHPSSSPSSATKRLPGQTQAATPVSATPASTNGAARPNRRPQRITTRTGTADNLSNDKKATKKFPEPWVAKESHILKKFDGRPPSLIVHLYPTNFRFEQQDGSFSYHSEMRVFIEHLYNGTVPHDMMEEFREGGVQFYDGWLIVKVVDHINASNNNSSSIAGSDDEKPFSVHNYNPYITPSPHTPYPTREQTGQKSPPTKQESGRETSSAASAAIDTSPSKPKPQVYHRLLRPTQMSKHMDMVLDALAPDPKSLNRKQSQANVNGRSAGGPPQTPGSAVPPTPLTEKGPPLKKQKMKIDSKDLLEYEGRVVNATAPPLYLDPVENADEADALLAMLTDPFHDQPPPSPRSRKRTVAELAAEDAHAKEQERFMLIMDERNAGVAGTAAVDGQAGNAIFQPRFERFNALETIKREMAEKKQREKDRQLQEDENRRDVQQRQAEEERRRNAQRVKEQQAIRLRQEQHEAHQLALQQQAAQQSRQQAQQVARQQQQQQQVSAIPPQVQSQMMANQQRSSPVIRQGTPHAISSPVVNNAGQGAGSPPRPGSAMQHGHPMARNQSNSGQSHHGTPQMPNATPGMRNATPVLRQGTPSQHMTQASPHGNMMAPTPQMAHAANMGGQMPNGMTPQQIEMQRRQQAQMRMQQMQAQQAMMGGNPGAQHNMAQQMAQRQAALHQQNMQQQQGQQQQMGHSPAQQSQQYKQGLAEQMKAQMQQVQGSNHGSPVQNQMTPQQQAAMVQQQQQQRMMQQGQMMGNVQHTQRQMNPAVQQFYQQSLANYQSRLMGQTASKYGGNPGNIPAHELQRINQAAQQYATQEVRKRQQQVQQQQAMRQQQAQQQGMTNGMNMMNPNMAAMQQQQQAQHMQGMQLAHAQQMLAQQQPNMYQMQQMQQQQQQQRQG